MASFLICNVPRVVLNVYELLTVGRMRDDACFTLPAWVSATAVLSYVLIATNSSVNFFLYCLVNPTFRAEFLERFLPCLAASGGNSQGNGGRRAGGGTPSQSKQASTTTKRSTIKVCKISAASSMFSYKLFFKLHSRVTTTGRRPLPS